MLGFLLTFGGLWTPVLMTFLFVLYILWIRLMGPTLRPCYENPPQGVVTPCSDLVDRFINIFCFHMIRPGFIPTFFHQGFFLLTLSAVKTILIDNFRVDFQPSHYLNNATEALNNCNFTLFSNSRSKISRIIHQVLNTAWNDETNENRNFTIAIEAKSLEESSIYPFKSIFSSESACIGLLATSCLLSLLYSVVYVRAFKLYDFKFPLQKSLKVWEGFLNRDWSDESLEKALQVLLLGVLQTHSLELLNYNLPRDLFTLNGIIHVYLEQNESLFSGRTSAFPSHLNPCNTHLNRLNSFLVEKKAGEEAVVLCNYFQNSFDLYLNQMTSHRIAQTTNILNGKKATVFCLGNFNSFLLLF